MSSGPRPSVRLVLAAPTEDRLNNLETVVSGEAGEHNDGAEVPQVVSRTLDADELLEIARELEPASVILLDADLGRAGDESPAEFWRELTDPPDSAPVVLYVYEPLLDPEFDHTVSRAAGYVGSWRPDGPQKVVEAIRLAATGVRSRFD